VTDVLGVAVVGVGEQQWSGVAHLPALASADGVQLVRLVTANPKSADRVYAISSSTTPARDRPDPWPDQATPVRMQSAPSTRGSNVLAE